MRGIYAFISAGGIARRWNDWDLFTPVFGSDPGVVFELYNEPNLTATPANWQLWLNGGDAPTANGPVASIGMHPHAATGIGELPRRRMRPRSWRRRSGGGHFEPRRSLHGTMQYCRI